MEVPSNGMRRTLADLVRCLREMGATRDIAGAIAVKKGGSKQDNENFNGRVSVKIAKYVSRNLELKGICLRGLMGMI